MTKINLKLVAIACCLIPILVMGWKNWSATRSQTLPPTTANAGNSSILPGRYLQVSVPPSPLDGYLAADFRIWIPHDVPTLRGAIVKVHGCGDAAAQTGLDHANDFQWQALAAKHQFALIGAKFPTGNKPCEYWALINNGSSDAFLTALATVATQSHHPELAGVPWVLWGHSGGADWSAQMLQQYPDRTIAVVAVRGGAFTLLGTDANLANIPVLFALGAQDKVAVKETHTLPRQVFDRYRRRDAPWALAIAAGAGHETGDTRLLAIPYLDVILTQRLPPDNKLRPIDKSQGWLGNLATHNIAPIDRFADDRLSAVWLPDENTAHQWQQYITTGKIHSTRAPMAPTALTATRIASTTALLTWQYPPDLAHGLPSFRIYRDRQAIGTVTGQGHDFGDAAAPPHIVLEFQDRNAQADASYSVGAINQLGENISQPTQLTKSG
jgi:pimeloyl-ACP methyl ester carboxylesterase